MRKLPAELAMRIFSYVPDPEQELAILDDQMRAHVRSCKECEWKNSVHRDLILNVEWELCTSPDDNPYGPCSVCRSGPSVVSLSEPSCEVAQGLNRRRPELVRAMQAHKAAMGAAREARLRASRNPGGFLEL